MTRITNLVPRGQLSFVAVAVICLFVCYYRRICPLGKLCFALKGHIMGCVGVIIMLWIGHCCWSLERRNNVQTRNDVD